MDGAIQVALVSRNSLFREGLRRLLDPERFSIIAEGRDLSALQGCFENGSGLNLVVMDLNAPTGEGLQDLQRLVEDHDDLRTVVLADELCIDTMTRALKAGVNAYLVNELSGEAFSLSLMLVMQGEKVLPSSLVDIFARDLQKFGPGMLSDGPRDLTDREKQILRCLLNGSSNKHIARALDISEGTVKVHLKSLMKKISAGNRTQAALWARNHGIGTGIDQVAAA